MRCRTRTTTGGFEGVYALVDEAAEGLLKAIREENGI